MAEREAIHLTREFKEKEIRRNKYAEYAEALVGDFDFCCPLMTCIRVFSS